MSDARVFHMCLSCLYPRLFIAVDRKGRGYLRCDSCGSNFFLRCGELGIATMLAVADRVTPEVAASIKAEALARANSGMLAQMAQHVRAQAQNAVMDKIAPSSGAQVGKVG
jgi:hypothetical protein